MPRYHRVVIVGVGLLGGSIGLALRQRGLADRIVGVGRSMKSLEQSLQVGAVTDISQDLSAACQSADLIVIGTPVQTIADFVKQSCATKLAANCLVTDVGSTKSTICRSLTIKEHQHFCGSHPMAGSEKTGVMHAREELLVGRKTIVTPIELSSPAVIERTEELWHSLGSDVIQMSPEAHDQAVSQVSHLPHVVAAALAAGTDEKLLQLTGDGWRDTTRVAGGDVELWRQIICENRLPLLGDLKDYVRSLSSWVSAMENNDQNKIAELLQRGKDIRDSLSKSVGSKNQDT